MQNPSSLKPWFNRDELALWVREAPSRDTYKTRLSIWLTYVGPFHAHDVANMLQVSKQAVWLWIKQYNDKGPGGLDRQGRGGRRWSFLSWADEQDILAVLEKNALQGKMITAKQMFPEIKKKCGKDISLAYVYRLLHRHSWRKVGPRPQHVKADPIKQEEFKKKFQKSSKKL